MTFLNPFILFGLAAAAIPILIHLLNKRKLRTIEFSTLSFLKELQKNTMRRITLRQWLLLLLRTLIIIFLVLAFSRPALKGNFGAIGSHAKSTLVILLDNTASMNLQNEKGKFLAQAQTEALEIISLMQENDDAFFLRLSDLPETTTKESTHDNKKLQALIQETTISNNRRTIDEGLRIAAELLKQSKNFNKEVYVITDGQASTLSAAEVKKKEPDILFDPQVNFFFAQLSKHPVENVGVDKVTIPPTLLQLNKPLTLNAVIKNYGINPVTNHIVSITLGNNRVMQKSVTLNGGESTTLDFTVIPARTGFIAGVVESEDDVYEPDNKYFFSLYIPEQIRVKIIAPEEGYSRYLTTALTVANTAGGSALISVSTAAPSQLTSAMLTSSDVLVLSGVKQMTETQQRMVLQYISSGGSALFFPANDTMQLTYPVIAQAGLVFSKIVQSPRQSPFRFEKADLDFPIFKGMFETVIRKSESIESPDISTTLSTQRYHTIRPIITLSNGEPFLWQFGYRSGTIIGCSVPASTSWSNLPLKGIFVPLLYQSTLYLSSQINFTARALDYTAGEKIEFSSSIIQRKNNSSVYRLVLIDPEHRSTPLQAYTKTRGDGSTETIFSAVNLPLTGEHVVLQEKDTVLSIPINISRMESTTSLAGKNEIDSEILGLGGKEKSITVLNPNSSLQETVLQSRFGIELWRYFALLAVVIALIEMIIAREKKEG